MNYEKLTAGKTEKEILVVYNVWRQRLNALEIPPAWRNQQNMNRQHRIINLSLELARRCRTLLKHL